MSERRSNVERIKPSSQRFSTQGSSNRRSSTPETRKIETNPSDTHRRSLESSIEDRHHEHQEQWTKSVEHLHRGTRYAKTHKAASDTIKIGDRIVVHGIHSGWLRFLGTVQFSSGVWAGKLSHDGCCMCALGGFDAFSHTPSTVLQQSSTVFQASSCMLACMYTNHACIQASSWTIQSGTATASPKATATSTAGRTTACLSRRTSLSRSLWSARRIPSILRA